MQKNKPNLIIIAGPNGSGKTTITKEILKHNWAKNTTYINPDEIAQEKFGGWNDKQSFIDAANDAQKIRDNCIKNQENLIFETVFSTEEKIDFVEKALKKGYFVRLFFIATNSPFININRIKIRVENNQHNVPDDKVISRYYKSLNNCIKIINKIDRCYVYDNSIENIAPKLFFRIANNDKQLIKQYENLNDWTSIIFNSIQ